MKKRMTRGRKGLIAGFDAGHGTCKAVYSDGRPTVLFPSTASPATEVSVDFQGHRDQAPLGIEGREWYAGFPANAVGADQPIFKGAALSDAHHALFLEFLDRTGEDIDALAVGVPADQIIDKELRDGLKERMARTHDVRGRKITVGRVGVYDQPRGSAWVYVESLKHKFDHTALIIDTGQGTTDVTLVRISVGEDGRPHAGIDQKSTHSLWLACRDVFERTAAMVKERDGCSVRPSTINSAFRRKDRAIGCRGKSLDITPYVEEAADVVTAELAERIRSHFRTLDGIDVLVLTGGGVHVCGAGYMAAFPEKTIQRLDKPEIANPLGFLGLAKAAANARG